MKKILFVLSQLSTGGAERVISILANNFDARGYEVHLITYVDVPNAYILNKEILWTKFPSISGNRIKQHLIRMRLIRKYIRDKQNLYIQSKIPVTDIFCIQSYNFFEVCNVTSSAYLPHTSDSRFNSDSSPVM